MDRDEYYKLLSEVAEYNFQRDGEETLIKSVNTRRRKKRLRLQEQSQDSSEEVTMSLATVTDLEEEQEEEEEDLWEPEANPTLPPRLTAVKYQPTVCTDCGIECCRSIHRTKRIYESANIRHWRERCLTCDRFRNPATGKFDLPVERAALAWANWLRRKDPQDST